MNKKIIAALSGGVDSAVTALLLQNEGYDVSGVTLIMCPGTEKEADDARVLCEKLGLPHTIRDCREEFKNSIMRGFAESYAKGDTPNPCVECNPKIKLGMLINMAKDAGFCGVATGHYANCKYSEKYGRKVISQASDPKKDQSYVLWKLSPSQVEYLVFPLGTYQKDETRTIAHEHGFSSAGKKDSQDICFINGDYADFVEDFLGTRFAPGEFVTEDGKVLGTHKGIIRYTTGQRKGLGLSLPAPLYVKSKDFADNRVILCPEDGLYTTTVTVRDVNFQAFDKTGADMNFKAFVKLRYSARAAYADVFYNAQNDKLVLTFDEPQRAATPGQSAVLYDEDGVLLGGGIICG